MANAAKKRGKADDLVTRMDAEAEDLLAKMKGGKVSLETRVATFAQIAKWVQVRNRIADPDETTVGLLNEYRARIDAAQSEIAEREAGGSERRSTRYLGKRPIAHILNTSADGSPDNGGAELQALISRLPGADEHPVDGDGGGGGGEAIAIAGRNRLVRPGLPGDTDTRFDEPHSDGDF